MFSNVLSFVLVFTVFTYWFNWAALIRWFSADYVYACGLLRWVLTGLCGV